MRALLSVVLRLVLLAVFTFGFVVLFEHGPAKFSDGAKTEWNALLFFVGSVLSRRKTRRRLPPHSLVRRLRQLRSPELLLREIPPGEGTNRPARGTPVANH
jgi:hypothetical protein